MRRQVSSVLLVILALNTGWFVFYSVQVGLGGLASDGGTDVSRVFEGVGRVATLGIALHMIAGAILTGLAPLQALPVLRRKWPRLHHVTGYILIVLAVVTGSGGGAYILLNGTIGGTWMSFWFAVYGGAMVIAAWRTVHHARTRDLKRHGAWATRLIILAVGSWIYRMHYGLWYAATGGLGSNDAFTGVFDRIQVVAFFVPYLLIAEFFLRRRARVSGASRDGVAEGH